MIYEEALYQVHLPLPLPYSRDTCLWHMLAMQQTAGLQVLSHCTEVPKNIEENLLHFHSFINHSLQPMHERRRIRRCL